MHAFAARVEGALVGAIVFSRMRYAGDARQVFVLAPVAVATDRQGQGVGTALIRHGLAALRARGVDVALTYGDPAYYGRIGFRPITTEDRRGALSAAIPHGWLGQALGGGPLRPLVGEVDLRGGAGRSRFLVEKDRFCPTDCLFLRHLHGCRASVRAARPFPMQVLRYS
jgi:predicted N-acetyltransferase YhbS